MKYIYIVVLILMTPVLTLASSLSEQAQILAHKYPIIDGHIDVPYRVFNQWEDVTTSTESGDFDYKRAKEGGLDAPFMSIYIPAEKEGKGAKALADVLIDQVEAILYRSQDWPGLRL